MQIGRSWRRSSSRKSSLVVPAGRANPLTATMRSPVLIPESEAWEPASTSVTTMLPPTGTTPGGMFMVEKEEKLIPSEAPAGTDISVT